jgi:putative GTP pyrophosphokinase
MLDLAERYEHRLLPLRHVADTLESRTLEALNGVPHIDRVSYRVKGLNSFLAKVGDLHESRYGEPLAEVEDQVGGRVIVYFTADLPIVRRVMLKLFVPVEVSSRRPPRDEEFGYQSEHLILMIPPWAKPRTWGEVVDPPRTFELQLRTVFMHAYAAPQHDIQYKSAKELPPDIRRELAWIAASAWGADAAYSRVRLALEAKAELASPTGT